MPRRWVKEREAELDCQPHKTWHSFEYGLRRRLVSVINTVNGRQLEL